MKDVRRETNSKHTKNSNPCENS